MDLIFVGGGGHYRDLLYISENDKYTKWNVIGYLDDNLDLTDSIGKVSNLPSILESYSNVYYCISINSSKIRYEIDSLYGRVDRSANLIHESAIIGSKCTYQNGITMGPYSVLTTGVSLGLHTHINSCVSINQNSSIGKYCTLSPGVRVCGDVVIGDTTSLGAGSVIINYKTIGSDCVIGAGTVAIKDVPNGSTVVGVPGRIVKIFGKEI